MGDRRRKLLEELERYYRGCGWPVERADDGTVRAVGTGGVTWIGMPVVASDLESASFEHRVVMLAGLRMDESGARCPLELLPDADCEAEVRAVLERLRLCERVSVYSLAA